MASIQVCDACDELVCNCLCEQASDIRGEVMITISSDSGRRLAEARAAVLDVPEDGKDPLVLSRQVKEFMDAARDVADELVAAGFADMEGE